MLILKNTTPDLFKIKTRTRYLQLLLLTIAGGAIYPMLYMRQIYQTTMLEAFQISNGQLGTLYALLGLFFFFSYAPSGLLADRINPMKLIVCSLLGTGLLGLWYSTLPDYVSLKCIYAGWGVTTGLTFWGAVMKRINLLAGDGESGRFYGFYDGGRGLVEALLASSALAIFSYTASDDNSHVVGALVNVIHMYAWLCIALAGLCVFVVTYEVKSDIEQDHLAPKQSRSELIADIILILRQPEVWLIAVVIAAGYHLFWATYSFSAYLQEGNWGFTAVMAGTITTIKLWLRPVGGVVGGILGDKYSNLKVLYITLLFSTFGLCGLVMVPMMGLNPSVTMSLCVFFILLVGLLTYAIRGLYWAITEHLNMPAHRLGLTIGIISVLGYCPDIFIPLINGYLMDIASTPQEGYQWYFGYIIFVSMLGLIACKFLMIKSSHVTSTKPLQAIP
ncbi:MAG: MFS transporter [Aeromonas veronii]